LDYSKRIRVEAINGLEQPNKTGPENIGHFPVIIFHFPFDANVIRVGNDGVGQTKWKMENDNWKMTNMCSPSPTILLPTAPTPF